MSFALCKKKKTVDKIFKQDYNRLRCVGAWCNGNTWVSKTFVEGSSPSAPAKSKAPPVAGFLSWQNAIEDSNRAAMNDSPVGCQNRDRASPASEVESFCPC